MSVAPPAVAAPLLRRALCGPMRSGALRGRCGAPLAPCRAPPAAAALAPAARAACVRRACGRAAPLAPAAPCGGTLRSALAGGAALRAAPAALRLLAAPPPARAPSRGARTAARAAAEEGGQKKARAPPRLRVCTLAPSRSHTARPHATHAHALRPAHAACARARSRRRLAAAAESHGYALGAATHVLSLFPRCAGTDQPARVHGEGLGGHRGGAGDRARQPAAGAQRLLLFRTLPCVLLAHACSALMRVSYVVRRATWHPDCGDGAPDQGAAGAERLPGQAHPRKGESKL
jgi:hypothetical protein